MNQRMMVFDLFGLDLSLFFSFPHLAKQLMLRFTKAEPELISDYDMSHLVRSNIRGGLSFCSQRLVKLETEKKGDQIHTFLDKEKKHPATMMYLDEVINNKYNTQRVYFIIFPFFSE